MKNLFLYLTFFTCFGVFAQQESEWQLIKEFEGIKFYSNEVEVELTKGSPAYRLGVVRVVNTTSNNVNLSFEFCAIFDEACAGCGDEESRVSITIPAGGTVENNSNTFTTGMHRVLFNPNIKDSFHFKNYAILSIQKN